MHCGTLGALNNVQDDNVIEGNLILVSYNFRAGSETIIILPGFRI